MRRFQVLSNAIFAAALLCAVGTKSGALAQQASPPVLKPQTTTVEVNVIADVIYDTNVAHSDSALATARGLKPSDESFRPSAFVNLGRRLGRQTLFLQGSVGYDFYRRNPILNRERIDLHPGMLFQFGRCAGSLSGNYGRHQSELNDLALVNSVSTLGVVKNTEEDKRIDLTATCGRAIGFAPTFDVSQSWNDNSNPRLQFNDSKTFAATAGLAYQRPAFGKATLFGNYNHTDFPNRQVLIAGAASGDGYDLYAAGLSYERHIGARLDGVISISYTALNNKVAGAGGFRGFTYSANGSYQIDPKLLLKLTFSRATLPSSRVGATFSVDNTVSGEFDYRLTSRLIAKVGGSYARKNYPVSVGLIGLDLTKENIGSEFGDVTYKLNRRISLDLNVIHTQRDANFAALSYAGTQVGLTVRSSF